MANRYLKDAVSEKIKPLDIERKQKIMERAIENPIPEPLAVFAMGLIDPETNQQIDAPSGSFGTAATKDVGTTNGTVPLIGAGDKLDSELIPESNVTYVSIRDFGAVGDGVADDTGAIQDALDTGKSVWFPNGVYKITSDLEVSFNGQQLVGENPLKVFINQSTSNQNGITILDATTPDPIQGPGAFFVEIRNLRITGNGIGVSTGDGINFSGVDTTYNGDWLRVTNCYIRGFERGIYLRGNGQSVIEKNLLSANNYGVVIDGGSANSISFFGTAVGSSGQIGILINSGSGGSYILGDQGNQPIGVRIATAVKCNIIGGNFESHSTRAIDVQSSAECILMGQRFLRGTGADTQPIAAAANSRGILIMPLMSGFTGTVQAMTKAGLDGWHTSGMTGSDNNLGVSSPGMYQFLQSGESVRGTPFASRPSNSLPSAATGLRWQILQSVGLTGVADRLIAYLKNASGTVVIEDLVNSQLLASANTWAASQTYSSGIDFIFNTSSGNKLGTSASQKIGFWNATPIVQPSGVTVSTALVNSGLIASPAAATVSEGGTGVATLTGLVKGNGTSAFTAAVSGTDYAPASGFTTTEVTGTSANLAINTRVIANNAGLVTLTLPTTAALGSVIEVVGKGAGGWRIAQNASQIINASSGSTTSGVTGSISSQNRYDCTRIVCITANTDWVIQAGNGTLTFV